MGESWAERARVTAICVSLELGDVEADTCKELGEAATALRRALVISTDQTSTPLRLRELLEDSAGT